MKSELHANIQKIFMKKSNSHLYAEIKNYFYAINQTFMHKSRTDLYAKIQNGLYQTIKISLVYIKKRSVCKNAQVTFTAVMFILFEGFAQTVMVVQKYVYFVLICYSKGDLA